jgi:uncharacterized OB-fold protein
MEIPRHWRLKAQRYRLEGSFCPTCGQLSFPPRPVCTHDTAQPVQIASGVIPVLPGLKHTVDTISLKG